MGSIFREVNFMWGWESFVGAFLRGEKFFFNKKLFDKGKFNTDWVGISCVPLI